MKSACSPEPFLRTEQEEVKNDITFLNAARDVVAPYSTYGRCRLDRFGAKVTREGLHILQGRRDCRHSLHLYLGDPRVGTFCWETRE